MRDAATGMAPLAVVNGDLVVAKDDLNSLAESGAIPRPSGVRIANADPVGPAPDPELDRRVAAAAEAIGLDMAAEPATEEEWPKRSDAEPVPFATPPDAAVEARTIAAASALGIELGQSKLAVPESRQIPPPSGGARRV